jgi:hypothetical protein
LNYSARSATSNDFKVQILMISHSLELLQVECAHSELFVLAVVVEVVDVNGERLSQASKNDVDRFIPSRACVLGHGLCLAKHFTIVDTDCRIRIRCAGELVVVLQSLSAMEGE